MCSQKWLDGRVVMQRPAKPLTPVRFRIQPPYNVLTILRNMHIMTKNNINFSNLFTKIHQSDSV